MGLNIDASKLTPEGYTVLRNFGLAVSRYYRAKPQEGFFPLPSGAGLIQTKRILPRSIETDYIDAWRTLKVCRDPELRRTLEQINKLYRAGLRGVPDDNDDASRDERIAKFRTESFHELVELVKELAKFGSTLK